MLNVECWMLSVKEESTIYPRARRAGGHQRGYDSITQSAASLNVAAPSQTADATGIHVPRDAI